jgi:hypothetical protein
LAEEDATTTMAAWAHKKEDAKGGVSGEDDELVAEKPRRRASSEPRNSR